MFPSHKFPHTLSPKYILYIYILVIALRLQIAEERGCLSVFGDQSVTTAPTQNFLLVLGTKLFRYRVVLHAREIRLLERVRIEGCMRLIALIKEGCNCSRSGILMTVLNRWSLLPLKRVWIDFSLLSSVIDSSLPLMLKIYLIYLIYLKAWFFRTLSLYMTMQHWCQWWGSTPPTHTPATACTESSTSPIQSYCQPRIEVV